MSIGIMIVTHGQSCRALVEEASFVLGKPLDEVVCVTVNPDRDPDRTQAEITAGVATADRGNGVIVLTDLMGASPANLVADLMEDLHAVMVTGVNLGMLIRVCNYRDMNLEQVVRKAVEGGRRAVKIFQK